MFDLERFRRWGHQVDHGNDPLVDAAIAEFDRLYSEIREIEKTMMDGAGLMATAMLSDLVETLPTPREDLSDG